MRSFTLCKIFAQLFTTFVKNKITMDKFTKCAWITRTIINAGNGGITLKDIQQKWDNAFGQDGEKELKRRSFENYKVYIASMFGIDIQCNKSDNTYFVEQENIATGDSLAMWLLNSFSMQAKLSANIALRERVLFEVIPGGTKYLEPLLHAIQESLCVEISYEKYWEERVVVRRICPYALKQYRQRWYVIAESDEYVKIFALDRIKDLQVTEQTFKITSDFNINEYFSEDYGIIHDQRMTSELVKIRFNNEQAKYINSLPWHESQRVVEKNEDYTTFAWNLRCTLDLVQQILSMGATAEVLEPAGLRRWVLEEMKQAVMNYK